MSSFPQGASAARLEALYVELETPVYNVVYRWLWNADDAHEVVQDAFVKLWQMRERIDWDTATPLVYRIAINLASNRRRWKKLRQWVGLEQVPEPAAETGDDPQARERHRAIVAAMDALPEKLRRVVLLCDVADMTYAEVGRALGIPAGTVGSRRNRALQLLSTQLGHLSDRGDDDAVA